MSSTTSSRTTLRQLDKVEDRIRQHLQVVQNSVLLVEGPDDKAVLEPHFEDVSIFSADGKVNVLRAAESLEGWNIARFTAVVDRDFGWEEPISKHILPYERRDLESMLIGLGVLAIVLNHQGSREKLGEIGGSANLVKQLENMAEPVASLRHRNAQEGYGLNFVNVDIASKVKTATLDFEIRSYCTALLAKSQASVPLNRLLEIAGDELPDAHGPRGKDVVSLAGAALRRFAGALPTAAVTESVLTGQLHSSAGLVLSTSEWLISLRQRLKSFE